MCTALWPQGEHRRDMQGSGPQGRVGEHRHHPPNYGPGKITWQIVRSSSYGEPGISLIGIAYAIQAATHKAPPRTEIRSCVTLPRTMAARCGARAALPLAVRFSRAIANLVLSAWFFIAWIIPTRSKVDFYSCTFTLGILPTHHFPIQRGDMFLLSVTKER
jgi:hypothetical protein